MKENLVFDHKKSYENFQKEEFWKTDEGKQILKERHKKIDACLNKQYHLESLFDKNAKPCECGFGDIK